MADDHLKQKYAQFQALQQNIEHLQEQLQLIVQQQAELESGIEGLEEISRTKLNHEILTPLANGIFLRTELENNQKLIVNIGADVAVEKTVPEIIELLERQQKELLEKNVEADALLQALSREAMKIYQEIGPGAEKE